MNTPLSMTDPAMLAVGHMLAELSAELDTDTHDAFYAEFQRLHNEGRDIPDILEGLMLFIGARKSHSAYPKLRALMAEYSTNQSAPSPGEEARTEEEICTSTRNALDQFMNSSVPTPAIMAPDANYRSRMPTLSGEEGEDDMPPSERETLRPEELGALAKNGQ